MTLNKIKVDSDLGASSLDLVIRQFVDDFGTWPQALICASDDSPEAMARAKNLNLAVWLLPQAIVLKEYTWAVVGDGDTIWSPGA